MAKVNETIAIVDRLHSSHQGLQVCEGLSCQICLFTVTVSSAKIFSLEILSIIDRNSYQPALKCPTKSFFNTNLGLAPSVKTYLSIK